MYGHHDDHLDYDDDDEEDRHSMYSSYSMPMSTYSSDNTYNSSLLSRRTSDMSISVDGQSQEAKLEKVDDRGLNHKMSEDTVKSMSNSSSTISTDAMIINFSQKDDVKEDYQQKMTLSNEASFVVSQSRRASAPMVAAAVAVAASKRNKQVAESSVSAVKSNRRQFIRRVERFGTDLFDPCLFPLALPMDGSDIYKGASTWESINLYADCVLLLWTEAAEKRKQLSTNKSPNNRWENAVLGNSSRYLVLQPQLPDRLFLTPDCRLPFRRTASETDLTHLGIGLGLAVSSGPNQTHNSKLVSAQKSVGGESVYSMAGDDEETGDEEAYQDRKNRSRSSLTTTNLAKRLTSLKEAAKDQRKDRFNLNLAKNMKTEAKRLASRAELQNNAYKFAKKISKLEKRYYLAVAGREFMSLLFKKGGGGTRGSSGHLPDLSEMLQFGQELSQLVADLVCSAFTVDEQGALLANVIEVKIGKKNFNLNLICYFLSDGLHSPPERQPSVLQIGNARPSTSRSVPSEKCLGCTQAKVSASFEVGFL